MCITLDNRSSKFNKNMIKNDELRSFANMLAEDAMNIRANLLHMSAIMATIASKRDSGILSEFDDSIVTFGEEKLGLKKSQIYSMVQVGATFLDSEGKSLLPEKGGKWSNTQFIALLPMSGKGNKKKNAEETRKACVQLVADGKIKPSMTVAEIKDIVSMERPDAKEKEEKAKKREEKKVQEQAAKEAVEKKIKGECIMNMQIWQKDNGKMYVTFNGDRYTFTDKNILEIVAMLKNTTNYKPLPE